MSLRTLLSRLARDQRGGAIMEFAILAPAVFTMMFGVMQIGLQMQNYNALRAVVSDVARYTVVEYQKQDKIGITQIEDKTLALAVGNPYLLDPDRIVISVTEPTSAVTNAKRFNVALTYTPANFLQIIGLGDISLNYDRSFYVPT